MGELIPGYRGPFSSTTEWHAFTIGFYHGFIDLVDYNGLPKPARDNDGVALEPHYAKGGYVCGAITRLVVLFIIFRFL